MASRLRTERTSYRTVGVASLKPAFGNGATGGSARPEWSLPSRAAKSQPSAEQTRSNAIEGGTEEKPTKKSPSDSARKRKDRRNLRERRHGTGVVILPGGDKVWCVCVCIQCFPRGVLARQSPAHSPLCVWIAKTATYPRVI